MDYKAPKYYILEIKFLSLRETPQINQMKFNDNIYEVTQDTILNIEIPSTFFEEDESKNSSIKLFKNSVLINECILEISKGTNYFYCFLDEKGYTFQLLFFKNQLNIRIPIFKDKYQEITNFDTNGTLTRKRFTFINANFFSIFIGDELFTIPSFFPELKSYQLSVYDIKRKLAVAKPLLLEEKSNFFHNFNKYYSLSYEFTNEIKNIIYKKKLGNISNYLKKYKDLNLYFFLNKSKSKLSNIFNNELFVDFYSSISLYKVIDKCQRNKDLKGIIDYYFKKINEIKEDKSLKIYQKILLIECFIGLCYDCESKEEIEKANFSYYLMERKEKNSILDLVEIFFKEYRDKLWEESPVFNKLIELDGDSGIYKKELFYCFTMQNLEEIKKHLKEIETNIFVIHDLDNKTCAYTDIISGIVSVNIHSIKKFKSLNIPLNKELPKDKKEIGEIIASKIIYYLLHEINGHKKFSYKKNKYYRSPSKFIENGEIYTLCQKNSNLKGENMIKIVPEGKIGEDGYFYELVYGKIMDYYTFEIMDNTDDFSDLLSEVGLWVNNLEKLREYIKYKYALQNYGSNFKSKKITIEEKINEYKNECLKMQNSKHIDIDSFFKKMNTEKQNNKNKKDNLKIKIKIKNTNKKKEKLETESEFNSSKDNKNISDNEIKLSSKKGKEKEETEFEKEEGEAANKVDEENEHEALKEESEEREEEDESEKDNEINYEEMEQKIMKLPYETLLMIEQTGILTKKQVYLMRKRKRSLLKTDRFPAIIDNNANKI